MIERTRYVRQRFSGTARLRAFWHMVMRGYWYEVCQRCGRPAGPTAHGEPLAWWRTADELWERVEGGPGGIRCPGCFTRDCAEAGVSVRWECVQDRVSQTTTFIVYG